MALNHLFLVPKYVLNPILPGGGGHYGPPYHESICCCRMVRATLTKLPDFVPIHICQVPESQFWRLFFKKLKKIDVKNFWGSSSIGRKSENFDFLIFLLTNPTFSSSIWVVHVLSFHLRCITPLKLKIFKILNFSTVSIDWSLPPSSD